MELWKLTVVFLALTTIGLRGESGFTNLDKKYWFVQENMDYFAAQNYCRSVYNDSRLASFHKTVELQLLLQMAPLYFEHMSQTFWIGVSGFTNRENYQWADNCNNVNRSRHEMGLLRNKRVIENNDSCVYGTLRDEMWRSGECTVERPFVCEQRPNGFGDVCGVFGEGGWVYHRETDSYYLILEVGDLDDGRMVAGECKKRNAHEASIHSNETNNFLLALVDAMKLETVNEYAARYFNPWIGLSLEHEVLTKEQIDAQASTRSVRNRKASWNDGSPVNFTNFGKGEPNNFGGYEDCVELFTAKSNVSSELHGQWNDISCNSSAHAFGICEKKL